MSKHTPGRWFVEHDSLRVLSDDPRATIVAEVTGVRANPQALADAHLIAAAPDMLGVLRELREFAIWAWRQVPDDRFTAIDKREMDDAIQHAAAAIAKAEGREP